MGRRNCRFVVTATLALMVFVAGGPGTARADLGDCSQPVTTGASPLATDCLLILQTAVGAASCGFDECVCSPKGTVPPAATDALICLQIATGQGGALNCPCVQSDDCESSPVPTCGGDCFGDGTCLPDPFDPGSCDCLNACEATAAPQCGGDCDEDEQDALCSLASIATGGSPAEDLCLCIPDGIETCESASAPSCGGACHPGATCGQQGNSCVCTPLPAQGTCAQASAPSCGGSCTGNNICENSGGTCSCVPFIGNESCGDANAPTCDGACAFGDVCAVEVGGEVCECFVPCEVAAPPTCGGACEDAGNTCTQQVITLGNQSLSLCACVPSQ